MRLAALALFLGGGLASAEQAYIVIPKATVYPGETLREDMLIVEHAGDGDASRFHANVNGLIGKVARRTLLRGRPIGLDAVGDPAVVANGAMVQVVYQAAGISIQSTGQALNAASIGGVVRVRNSESGLIVTGSVAPDGTVRVGG
jgi:flagella basal body P-ring formation protein FlgA